MSFRKEKVSSLLRDIVASFISSKAKAGTIVSVTKIDISSDLKNAKVFVSVFPEDKEAEIISHLSNYSKEMRGYVKSKLKMKFLPFFTIKIDEGEKNRQKLMEKN